MTYKWHTYNCTYLINREENQHIIFCIEIYEPVCGCNDVTYDNECYAEVIGGISNWTEGECLD